jgi:hypothetical protein
MKTEKPRSSWLKHERSDESLGGVRVNRELRVQARVNAGGVPGRGFRLPQTPALRQAMKHVATGEIPIASEPPSAQLRPDGRFEVDAIQIFEYMVALQLACLRIDNTKLSCSGAVDVVWKRGV